MPLSSKTKSKTAVSTNQRSKLKSYLSESNLEYIERCRMRREEIMSDPRFMYWDFDVEADEDGHLYEYEVPVYKS